MIVHQPATTRPNRVPKPEVLGHYKFIDREDLDNRYATSEWYKVTLSLSLYLFPSIHLNIFFFYFFYYYRVANRCYRNALTLPVL